MVGWFSHKKRLPTCLWGPLRMCARAPSHAVLMASIEGVPNRSVIKSSYKPTRHKKCLTLATCNVLTCTIYFHQCCAPICTLHAFCFLFLFTQCTFPNRSSYPNNGKDLENWPAQIQAGHGLWWIQYYVCFLGSISSGTTTASCHTHSSAKKTFTFSKQILSSFTDQL